MSVIFNSVGARARRATALTVVVAASLALAGCSGSSADDDSPDTSAGTSAATPGENRASGEPGSGNESGDDAPDGDREDDDSSRTTPERPSLPVPDEVRDETGATADDYVDTVGDVLKKPDSSTESVPTVTGPALEQLLNTIAEYEAAGWKVVGQPMIVRQRVVKYFDDPESAVVRACLDNSDVRVVDAQGRTVPGSVPANPRTLNLFTMVKEKGDWVISDSRPAPSPDC